MWKRIGSVAALVATGVLLVPQCVWAQADGNQLYEVPPPNLIVPTPLGNPRMEEGGLYTAGQFLFMHMSNPMQSQILAFHGVLDRDGSIGNNSFPGNFIGDHTAALETGQVSGPGSFTPGWTATIGWRFRNGLALEFSWMHLEEVHYSASANIPVLFNPGDIGQNNFLFSPVFNYPQNFTGPLVEVNNANPGAASGIWNGATQMTIDFTQRFDQADIAARYPLGQGEGSGWRCYGLFGLRMVAIWERFRWLTVDPNINGVAPSNFQATYSNVVSNRLWGAQVGWGNDWEFWETPIGSFSFSLDLHAALFADFVSTQAKYELGDLSAAASRKRNFSCLSPELQASLALWWYPYEAIQVRLGYDFMVFFNTYAAPYPVDFNMGAIAVPYEDGITRLIHGLTFGVGVSF
jgi:hypothetical protein